jgi:predicted transcriptional regulator
MSMSRKKVGLSDFEVMDERFHEGMAVARALDEKKAIPHAIKLSHVEFGEFMSVLTPKRYALLKLAARASRSIAELALAAKRDRSAVSRDVAKLASIGLVQVVEIPNAGHGLKKIVQPVARQVEIVASVL